jgi:type I restriction enzyme S subunit
VTFPLSPCRFETVALGRVVSVQLGKMLQPVAISSADVEVPYLRAGLIGGGFNELPTMWASPLDLRRYEASHGDLLVAEGGDVGRAEFIDARLPKPTIIQNSLHRLRAPGADLRYVRYCLLALREAGWIDVVCNRSTFGHLTREKLIAMRIPWPSASLRRRIADFLDLETARLNTLSSSKRRMIELLDQRRALALTRAFQSRGLSVPRQITPDEWRAQQLPAGWRVVLLGRVLAQLTNGFVGPTRDILVDEGVRYVQGMHIKKGQIDFDRRPFYVAPAWHSARPRTTLRAGDVVIVQTGDIGQCAVVPKDFGAANCHALLIARVNPSLVSSDYLGTYLQTAFGHAALLRLATGALHPHLEFGIRDAPIVVPPLEVQLELVAEVARAHEIEDGLAAVIDGQLHLLVEHRQALITAAVTGELDVTKAA